MPFYRKKPVVIEALYFHSYMDAYQIGAWSGSTVHEDPNGKVFVNITTLEGVMRADVGDYVIKGVKGEFYPCKSDIFQATYEAVE